AEENWQEMIHGGDLREDGRYSGHRYGTSWAAIEKPLETGRDVLLEIETEGARQVRERRPDAHLIFLLPPSLAELEARLQGRRTDDAAEGARRLAVPAGEFGAARLFGALLWGERAEA